MRKIVALVAAVAVGGTTYFAWSWYQRRDIVLSQEPVRIESTLTIPDQDSSIGLRLTVPLPALEAALDRQVPASFDFGGNGEDVCARVPIFGRVCAGTRYRGTVRKAGDVELAPEGTRLHASLPLTVSGNGGFRGDGARLLDLDAKNFRAGVRVSLVAGFDLSPDWCPIVPARASFDWTQNARVEIVSRVWVDVSGQVEGPIRDALADLPEQVQRAIPCNSVQDEIRSVWRTYSFPIEVGSGQTVYLHLDPQSAGFSGVTMAPDRIRLAAALRVRSSVDTAPGPTEPKPGLPPLVRISDELGRITLAIPVRVAYEEIVAALTQEVAGKSYSAETPAGPIIATFSDFAVFPTEGERIAIGASFEAAVPGRILDISGRLHVTARPVLDDQNVRLAEIGVTRVLDSEIAEVASVLFEQEIRAAIERAAAFDLAPLAETATRRITEAVTDPARTGGIVIDLSKVTVGLERIVPETRALAALLKFEAAAEATLVSLPGVQ